MKFIPVVCFCWTLFGCIPNEVKTNGNLYTDSSWVGEWEREIRKNGASLKIGKIERDSLSFNLFASSGGALGELEGRAIIRGNTAEYINEDCIIEFQLIGDTVIAVDQKEGLCDVGLGVWYSGMYYNVKYSGKPKPMADDLLAIGLLKDTQANDLMKKLTGNDYNLFVVTTQLTSEDEDLDNLNAEVYSSGVRGLFTIMENIIMIDSNNTLWAAVIDEGKIYYYTSSQEHIHTLPKTIENWRSRFSDYPVYIKSVQK